MIRMMTEENAEALDAQIARSYRRRLMPELRFAQKNDVLLVARRPIGSRGATILRDGDQAWRARLAGDVTTAGSAG